MMLTGDNAGAFASLLRRVDEAAADANGAENRPVHILQLTHSGRYSRPAGHRPRPIVPQRDPILDARSGVGGGSSVAGNGVGTAVSDGVGTVVSDGVGSVVSDAYLDGLIGDYAKSAVLAREAGFNGIDVKACHRYLISELLAAHTRDGKYGVSFENRTRFLREVISAVRAAAGNDFIVACRFNVFDAHPYPYGFGCAKDDFWEFDPKEPSDLVGMLKNLGVGLLSNSAGNPYYIYPQVLRPFDKSSMGIPIPDEHPLTSIERLFSFTELVTKSAGGIPVVGNGYSWLREYAPNAGAANLKDGKCSFVGFGRMSFAYPDAPREILVNGSLNKEKCCAACSKCTQIMRDHGRTGCVMRDGSVYLPLYRKYRAEAAKREKLK
jgi:2,4-dienoyl-CoA reductase-like NADH-dependent reductase (Old Yellow Enzyme family)